MKRISKTTKNIALKVGSRYYSVLLKFVALVSIIIIGLTVMSGIVSLIVFFEQKSYQLSTVNPLTEALYRLTNTLLIGGGFGIGWLATRKANLSKRERITFSASFGLLAYIIYLPLTFSLSVILYQMSLTTPLFFEFQFIIPLVMVSVFGLVIRKTKVNRKRAVMIALVGVFWLSQGWYFVQSLVTISRSAHPDASSWISLLGTVALPLVLFGVFYAPLKPIGRLARVFYATTFIALTSTYALSLYAFSWSNNVTFSVNFGTFTLILTLAFMVAVITRLILMRKTT